MTAQPPKPDQADETQQRARTGTGWPAISYESLPWDLDDRGPISKTQRRRVAGPYEAAITANIANIDALPLPLATQALADDATAAIARFDGSVGTLIAPFASVLLRSESAASSKIEQLTASARAIALAELGVPRANNASQIVANTRAMQAALALADSLDGQAIIALQDALLGTSHPEFTGQWRDQQVWIGGSNFGPHDAQFIPPHHTRVPAAIDDLATFLARNDLPALAHAALAHAQFETIHPFPDGNGRTGRALIHALLRARGVTTNVTIPVSAGLLTNTSAYFEALTSYREGDIEPIVTSLANAAFAAIHNGGILVTDLQEIRASWDERLRSRRDSAAWRIADSLLAQPAVSWAALERDLSVGAATAYRAIDALVEAEILKETNNNKRGRIWIADEVLDALDEFAARAGRRARPSAGTPR